MRSVSKKRNTLHVALQSSFPWATFCSAALQVCSLQVYHLWQMGISPPQNWDMGHDLHWMLFPTLKSQSCHSERRKSWPLPNKFQETAWCSSLVCHIQWGPCSSLFYLFIYCDVASATKSEFILRFFYTLYHNCKEVCCFFKRDLFI